MVSVGLHRTLLVSAGLCGVPEESVRSVQEFVGLCGSLWDSADVHGTDQESMGARVSETLWSSKIEGNPQYFLYYEF